MMEKSRAHWHLAMPLSIAGVGLIIHREILQTAILDLDSYAMILTSRIQNFPDFIGTFTEIMMDGRLEFADFYRPVGNLFLAMDYASWGIEPFGYQLTSLLVWCSTIVTLYLLMFRILGPTSWVGPSIAALFYALHPVALSVIPMPDRRSESLVILFTALALSVLPRAPSRGTCKNYLIAGLLTMLAAGSKETGVLAVGLIFIHQACSLELGGVRERIACGLRTSLPAAVLTLGLMIVRYLVVGGLGGYHAGSQQTFTAKLTEFVPEYFFAMLCSGYFDMPSRRVLVTTLGVAAITAVSLGLIRTSREKGNEALRRLPRVVLLAAAWLGATVLLSCMTTHFSPRHVLPMTFTVAMMLGAFGEGVAVICRHKDWETRFLAITAGGALLFVAIGALHGSPLVTRYPELKQATRYQTQALASLKYKIDSASAGEVIDADFRGRIPIRAAAVDDAWMISPWGLEAWLEIVYPERRFTVQHVRRQGMPIEEFWSVRLLQLPSPMEMRQAFDLRPESIEIFLDLGGRFRKHGRTARAEQLFREALELDACSVRARLQLSDMLRQKRRFSEQRALLEARDDSCPSSVKLRNALAFLLASVPEASLRDGGRALRLARAVVEETQGKHPDYLDTLAAAYAEVGEFERAVAEQKRALELLEQRGFPPQIVASFEQHLASFEAGQPIREPEPSREQEQAP